MVAFADQTLTSVGLLRYYALLHGKADTGTSAGGCTAGLSFGYVPFPAIPFPLAPHGDSPPAVAVAARRRSSTIIFRQLGRQPAKRPTRSGQGPRERKKEGCDRWREGGWPCNISRMPVSHLRPRTRRAQRQRQQQQQPSGVHCCSPVSMQGHRHDARDDARRSLRCWPLPSTPEVGVAVSRIIRAV